MEDPAASASPPKEAFNLYGNNRRARQLSESVDDFLKRLPPRSTSAKEYGSWIYCADPYAARTYENKDQATLMQKGRQLLDAFTALKAGIHSDWAHESKKVIEQHLAPHRAHLATSLLALARETACTSGKWMLFPPASHVNKAWSLIAHGTVRGEQGFAAKVGTDDDGSRQSRLICIYTADFGDRGDVRRVLERILGMGLGGGKGRLIYYKADVFTYLDLMRGNRFGLKTSLFSSGDFLGEGR